MKLGAVVLCGGHSRRMGGRPKAWLPFGPEPLLARVVRLAGEAVEVVAVVGALGQELPPLPARVRILRDLQPDEGPLRGLATGFAGLPDDVELVYVTATDAPFLQRGWIDRLRDRIGMDDLAIVENDGRLHPLAALYRRSTVLPIAERLLGSGERRLRAIASAVQARRIPPTDLIDIDPDLRSLWNLNTPEEYLKALRDAGFLVELPETDPTRSDGRSR